MEVPGCVVIENFISEEQETYLLESKVGSQDSEKWIGNGIGRRQQHYGYHFNYYTRMIDYINSADEIPQYCAEIASKITDYLSIHDNALSNIHLNQLTVNEYIPGQGIGNHVDTVNCIGPVIASLSLGSGCVMTLTSVEEIDGNKVKHSVFLPARSVIILSGDARYRYTHGISARKNDIISGESVPRNRRVSLTFRQAVSPGNIPSESLKPTEIEKQNVFEVYDTIAVHWHHTRGKRKVFWHRVKAFLESLPKGSLVADVGCGDGKYFGVTEECGLVMIGCDRSFGLLETIQSESTDSKEVDSNVSDIKNQVFCCDAVQVPLVSGAFDAAICIAVLHHLGTVDRRVAVIRELVRVVRPGGFIMIQAWAFEQEESSRHQFGSKASSSSDAAENLVNQQDVFVPWRLQLHFQGDKECVPNNEGEAIAELEPKPRKNKKLNKKLRKKAELEKEILESSEDYQPPPPKSVPIVAVNATCTDITDKEKNVDLEKKQVTFQRYCHVYREGELENLCSSIPGCRIVESGYDKSNWFVLLERVDLSADERFSSDGSIPVGLPGVIPSPPERVAPGANRKRDA